VHLSLFFLCSRPPPSSTLFPYTTLFRSEEILKVIGTDLNGYVLDDCAIDYLEQTPLEKLNPNNILDAEGIKKITDLTAREHILRSEEHTSELQSRENLVCRLLLEKKKNK